MWRGSRGPLALVLVASTACSSMITAPLPLVKLSAVRDAAALQVAKLESGGLRGAALAKPMSEALLAAAAARDVGLSVQIIDQMLPALQGDNTPLAMWLRGRMLLAEDMLSEGGLALPIETLAQQRYTLRESLDASLTADPCDGWACAYWVVVAPESHERFRPRLEAAAAAARDAYAAEPATRSVLLWTHGMNAYASASACLFVGGPEPRAAYESSVRAFAADVGAPSLGEALETVPEGDYPRWLGSYLLAAASMAGDDAAFGELAAAAPPPPVAALSCADEMLDLAMRLLLQDGDDAPEDDE